ncbi:UNVERIFIED_CONTAM: hypothetical protein GTU68_060418 [Idotea baltica]|nr:hypothetical protein [Idotea baltica]
MPITENQYQHLIDNIQQMIEDTLDQSGLDLDIDSRDGVLSIVFDNDVSLIMSRQVAMRQIWVAAKSGGFHFKYSEKTGIWLTRQNELLTDTLTQLIFNETNKKLEFFLMSNK